MEYRVEKKYIVSDLDLAIIAKRLEIVMKQDANQEDNYYQIRSLYFDDLWDTCLNENEAGIDYRKKYRIRIYDTYSSPIKLEIKEKKSGFTKKTMCPISKEEYSNIISNNQSFTYDNRKPLQEWLIQNRCKRLAPKAIIVYDRTAFVHPSGNVRITFDRNIMVSKDIESFFDKKVDGLIPILPKGMNVLEVKYDGFLPDYIAKQLEIGKLQQTAFSKYYLGRLALNGEFPID